MATILIIEDNPANMKLACLLMRNAGHAVLTAQDAETGLTIARSERPDLVLMDIQLPDIDGITALRRIREDSALDAIPVLAVSASVMPDEQQKIVTSGFDAYITKPIVLKPFLETVQRFLTDGRKRV